MQVGIQTRSDKGKFQLAIDGVNQGLPQDEYSSSVGYTVRDLGSVTFATAGNKAISFTVAGRNASSSGYTLAFDYIDLIPTTVLETESLQVLTKSSAPSGVFASSLASGGAGTYFNATALGQYITYAVPVLQPGNYSIKLGVQTKPNKGICQLTIDGAKQGLQQDGYSSAVGYSTRDLGIVTFGTAGTKQFQFSVTGANPNSTGYTLAFDYIYLQPIGAPTTQRSETEALKVQAITPPPPGISSYRWSGIFNSRDASGLAGTFLNANAVGNYITYTVPVGATGLYRVRVGIQTKANKGKFQLSINGTNQGQVQDEYAPSVTYGARELGTIFLNQGNQSFSFSVTGKSTSSTGYALAFDYIELVPTDRAETESLNVQSVTPAPSGYSTNEWFGVFNASNASSGAGTYLNAIATGNYITYTIPVAKSGTYHVLVGVQEKPNKGIFQLAVGGLNQGPPQDEYYPSVTYGVRDLGTVYLNSGNQPFKFTVTGKNPGSTGYTLAFDYIELVP